MQNQEQQARWQQIKDSFARANSLGSDDTRIANQVMNIVEDLNVVNESISTAQKLNEQESNIKPLIMSMEKKIDIDLRTLENNT